jgi:hypothetical protein
MSVLTDGQRFCFWLKPTVIKQFPWIANSIAVGFNRRFEVLLFKDFSSSGFIGLKPFIYATLNPLAEANGN